MNLWQKCSVCVVMERTWDWVRNIGGIFSIIEVNGAHEFKIRIKPLLCPNSESAGDSVRTSIKVGSTVRLHTISDCLPVYVPGHTNVIRVEIRGHADQGLLPWVPLALSAFLIWRWKNLYVWITHFMFCTKFKKKKKTHENKTTKQNCN